MKTLAESIRERYDDQDMGDACNSGKIFNVWLKYLKMFLDAIASLDWGYKSQ